MSVMLFPKAIVPMRTSIPSVFLARADGQVFGSIIRLGPVQMPDLAALWNGTNKCFNDEAMDIKHLRFLMAKGELNLSISAPVTLVIFQLRMIRPEILATFPGTTDPGSDSPEIAYFIAIPEAHYGAPFLAGKINEHGSSLR